MLEYVPNERIVARAAHLWRQALENPRYDNGDKSSSGFMGMGLARMIPKNNTPDVLDKFESELRSILMAPLKWEYENSVSKEKSHHETLFSSLSVDYGPDIPLAEAANRAGLKMEFPWKTYMYLTESYLSFSRGYGARSEYHYPLSEDRWLVCLLSGEDIKKIIDLVESGLLGLDLAPNVATCGS